MDQFLGLDLFASIGQVRYRPKKSDKHLPIVRKIGSDQLLPSGGEITDLFIFWGEITEVINFW
jgi:hypothetical protein